MQYKIEAYFGFCSHCGPAVNNGELLINRQECPVCGNALTEQIASSEAINRFICDDDWRPMFEPEGDLTSLSLHTLTLYSLELRDHISRPYPQAFAERMVQRLEELQQEINRRQTSGL